jgi:hypothetical protein
MRDSGVGCWLSRDPMGEAGGLNLYGYVGNNPISFIDPLGNVWYDPLSWVGASAVTLRLGPAALTIYGTLYYQETPEAQNATRVHEDIHAANPNQQPWNDINQREIDAYTAEINYELGQIANLKLQIQQLQTQQSQSCSSQGGSSTDNLVNQQILRLQTQIKNYYDAYLNAQNQLGVYEAALAAEAPPIQASPYGPF